jgi:hypothetical protein
MIGDMKAQNLKRMVESKGLQKTLDHLREALQKRYLRPEDFSIKNLFAGLVDNGEEVLRRMEPGNGGGMRLAEAVHAVDTSAFSNITGQIFFNKIQDAYRNENFIWPELVETIPTTNLNGERIPGIGAIGDKSTAVAEGNPYPVVGVSEIYVDTPPPLKFGEIVAITREALIADRTGLLLKRASDVGQSLGFKKEKAVLDCVLGVTNTYKRNGTSSNTYLTSGAYINSQTGNSLVNWRNVENADLLFAAITDPSTGEPVMMPPNRVLICPPALRMTALRILRATSVEEVDNRVASSTMRASSPNPLGAGYYTVVSNQYVYSRTSSNTQWFYGAPKEAFAWMQVWDIQVLQAPVNSEVSFTHDIEMRFRADYMGIPAVLEPRKMTKNDA